jgi:hypothetical protein
MKGTYKIILIDEDDAPLHTIEGANAIPDGFIESLCRDTFNIFGGSSQVDGGFIIYNYPMVSVLPDNSLPDISGNGFQLYKGTGTNVTFVNDFINGAKFNGATVYHCNQNGATGTSSWGLGVDALTISVWCRPTTTQTSYIWGAVYLTGGNYHHGYMLYLSGNTPQFYIGENNTSSNWQGYISSYFGAIPNNQWSHITGIVSPNASFLYVNGKLAGYDLLLGSSTIKPHSANTSPWSTRLYGGFIGGRYSNNAYSNYYTGDLANLVYMMHSDDIYGNLGYNVGQTYFTPSIKPYSRYQSLLTDNSYVNFVPTNYLGGTQFPYKMNKPYSPTGVVLYTNTTSIAPDEATGYYDYGAKGTTSSYGYLCELSQSMYQTEITMPTTTSIRITITIPEGNATGYWDSVGIVGNATYRRQYPASVATQQYDTLTPLISKLILPQAIYKGVKNKLRVEWTLTLTA